MKYHEPIKNFIPKKYPDGDVMQWFGENPELYQACCNLKAHSGWDIVRAYGTPIFCVEKGKVVDVKEDVSGNGKHIRVLCETNEWMYGHMSRIDVKLGQQLEAGDQIGLMGNSGFVTSDPTPYWKANPYAGTHLHLTRYPVDNRLEKHNRFYPSGDKTWVLNTDNGHRGAEDFSPEDFELSTPVDNGPSLEATLQSLEYHAKEAEKQGKTAQAAMYRAVQGLVKVFWK